MNNGLLRNNSNDDIFYIKEFVNSYYANSLKYRASDLLKIGLSSNDLQIAIRKALTVCRTAGHSVNRHFLPIYISNANGMIRDCKLSKLGYMLVIVNAKIQNTSVANFQMKVLSDYLNK